MASNVPKIVASRCHNLAGIGFESVFGTAVSPSIWIPVTNMEIIKEGKALIDSDVALGQVVKPSSGNYQVMGLKRGTATLNMPFVPLHNNFSLLLGEILFAISTSGGATTGYTHAFSIHDVAGNALNQAPGLTIVEQRDGVKFTLAGGRIKSLKLKQEQNKPLSADIEIEGAIVANAAEDVTPSITLLSTDPMWKFSHFSFNDGAAQSVNSIEIDITNSLTDGDSLQALGSEQRSNLDVVSTECKIRIKRYYAYDGGSSIDSKYRDAWEAGTVYVLTAKWLSAVLAGSENGYWTLQVVLNDARILGEPKITEDGGVVMEEVEFDMRDDGSDEPIVVTALDETATPATRSWS
jgi:hypothetical protein